MLGAGDTVQIEKNATLWNLRGRSYFGRLPVARRWPSGRCMRRAHRVRRGSGCRSDPSWCRGCSTRPNVAASSGSMCLPARYGCDGSSVSRNGSGRSGRSEDLRRGRLALPPGSAAPLCRAYPTHLFDTFCRLVDRYVLDLSDEVEHGALGATAEAIETLRSRWIEQDGLVSRWKGQHAMRFAPAPRVFTP